MVTDVKGYRKLITNEIKLPSGAEFIIKGLPAVEIFSMFDEFGIDMQDQKLVKDYFSKNPEQVMKKILPIGVVSPKVTLEETEDSLGIGEIVPGDTMSLCMSIMELSGMGKKTKELMDSFREKR